MLQHLRQRFARQRNISKIDEIEKIGPQAIVDVVGVVGDIIRNRRHLGFR